MVMLPLGVSKTHRHDPKTSRHGLVSTSPRRRRDHPGPRLRREWTRRMDFFRRCPMGFSPENEGIDLEMLGKTMVFSDLST